MNTQATPQRDDCFMRLYTTPCSGISRFIPYDLQTLLKLLQQYADITKQNIKSTKMLAVELTGFDILLNKVRDNYRRLGASGLFASILCNDYVPNCVKVTMGRKVYSCAMIKATTKKADDVLFRLLVNPQTWRFDYKPLLISAEERQRILKLYTQHAS